jgi:hypothetical protein
MCMRSSDGSEQGLSVSENPLVLICSRASQAASRLRLAAGRLALVAFVVVAGLVAGPGVASAQTTTPTPPTLGIEVDDMLTAVNTRLSEYMGPFIIFTIGICGILLVWSVVRGFARGRA